MKRILFRYFSKIDPYFVTAAIFLSAFIFYSYLSILKYMRYQAYAFDLGIYAESSWKIAHGMLPISTIRGINQFGDHFSPVYIVLSLGYGLFNTPIYLLLLQIGSILVGGIPVFLIAREKLKSTWLANCILVGYLLQIGVIQALNFDFHLAALSVGFISWTIYFWYKQQFRLYLLFLTLSLFCKEDVAVLFGFFSIYLLFKRQWQFGLATLFYSGSWLFITLKLIIPQFSGKTYGYTETGNFTQGWDVKLDTLSKTFGQNLGLALLSPLGVSFSLGNFATRFLSASSNRWMSIWHYGANIAPALSIASVLTLSRFNKKVISVLAMYIVVATFFIGWPFRPQPSPRPYNRHHLDEVVESIPESASVSAQDILVPHLANREKIYLFPNNPNADYIILAPGLPAFPLFPQELDEKLALLEVNPEYKTESHYGIYVFTRISKP